MGKQQIQQRKRVLSNRNAVGEETESSLTIDDNLLPSPDELRVYKEIDPNIVNFLIEVASKEQNHRHEIDNQKVEIIKSNEKRDYFLNIWGMFFAFMAIVVLVALSAWALYLDRAWFAGFFGVSAMITIVSIFATRRKARQ